MRIIKVSGSKIHVGCGGVVIKGTCIQCGEAKPKKSLTRAIFGEGPLVRDRKEEFDERDYKKRIREGRDLRR